MGTFSILPYEEGKGSIRVDLLMISRAAMSGPSSNLVPSDEKGLDG